MSAIEELKRQGFRRSEGCQVRPQDNKYLLKVYGTALKVYGTATTVNTDLPSKTEPYRELNNSRVTAGGDDASEGAGIEDPAGIGINRSSSVEVAHRVGQVHVVEQIEEFGADHKTLRLC